VRPVADLLVVADCGGVDLPLRYGSGLRLRRLATLDMAQTGEWNRPGEPTPAKGEFARGAGCGASEAAVTSGGSHLATAVDEFV
jgi:hypothetical protein